MPGGRGFVSGAQRGFMYANHPDIAKRFQAETPKNASLPYHVGKDGKGPLAHMYGKKKGK